MRTIVTCLSMTLLVLGFSSLATPAWGQACDLQVGGAVAAPGDTITIPVMINAAPNAVEALGLDLSFDPEVLHFTGSFTPGDLVTNWDFFDVEEPTSGTVRVGGFTTVNPISAGASGVVVELQFQVICTNCGAETVTTLTPTNLVDDLATWNACAGEVTVLFCVEGQGLAVGDRSGTHGATVSIPVSIAEQGALNDVEAMGLDLNFDPDVLHYSGSFTPGDLVANWEFFDVNVPEPGVLRIGGFTTTDPIPSGASGTVVELEFEVNCPDCEQGETRDLFMTQLVDDLVGWPACPGAVTISTCANCGDTDENGTITPQDALLAFQHFLQLIELEGCPLTQADVDNNGEITPADALEIFKKFLQLPSVIDDNPLCSL